ncbi:MAG TPA: hypothetical protein VFC21_09855 [Bryobacteraceae bacterium]|nr:hypothetical protein [Bryobacteraceae bacterium]
MRLHLDSGLTGSSDAARTSQLGSPATSVSAGGASRVSGSPDSVAISGPSSALNRLTADRDSRIEQLSAAVRSGSYRIPSAALSSAIVSSAVS